MAREGLSPAQARRLYDRMAYAYNLLAAMGGRAKAQGLAWLAPRSGERVIEVGCGAGVDLRRLRRAVDAQGLAAGVDVSWGLLRLARRRTDALLVQADALALPWATGAFDALYAAYILDLLPPEALVPALREWRRVVRPGGRAVIVTMTEGTGTLSRVVMMLWNGLYRLSPALCAGCRPLHLAPLAAQAGWRVLRHEVIVEWGFPSEVVLLVSKDSALSSQDWDV